MRSIAVLWYFYLFCFLVFSMLIGGINYFRDDVAIPSEQIIITIALYLFYCVTISSLIVGAWNQTRIRILTNVILYLFLTFTFIPFIDFLVHDFLPHYDIIFFDMTLPENNEAFRARLISGYVTVNAFACITCLGYGATNLLRERRQLNRDLKLFRDRVVGLKYTSHFLATIFIGKFGEMLINKVPKDNRAKRDIIQFLAYLLEVEHPAKMNPLQEELDNLECFVRLLKMYYGEGSIDYDQQSVGPLYRDIPTGVLFFPLENCLKHANISVDDPVQYNILINNHELSVTCRNTWSPKHDLIKSGTGFALLNAKLALTDYPSSVETSLEEDIFYVNMNLKFNEVK